MERIFIILLFTTNLFSKTLDTYNVSLAQIDTIRYLGDERIVVELKDRYWETFFEFTRTHISKKVIINIDTISITPSIFYPMYDIFELSSVRPEYFSENLKLFLNKKNIEDKAILLKKRNTFLNKMLKKYARNSYLITELIKLYHNAETVEASKQCIELYEDVDEKIKEKIVIDNYNNVLNCYLDLNNTTKALDFLAFVKQKVYKNDLYLVVEKEAYVYTLVHQPKKAKEAYIEALKILKKTNIKKDLLDSDTILIQEIEAMKESEIKRLKRNFIE